MKTAVNLETKKIIDLLPDEATNETPVPNGETKASIYNKTDNQ